MGEDRLDKIWSAFEPIQVIEGNGTIEVLLNGQRYMKWRAGDEATNRLAIV